MDEHVMEVPTFAKNLGILLKVSDRAAEGAIAADVLFADTSIAAEHRTTIDDESVLDFVETWVVNHGPSRAEGFNEALRPENQLIDNLTILELFAINFAVLYAVDALALIEHSQDVFDSIFHYLFPLPTIKIFSIPKPLLEHSREGVQASHYNLILPEGGLVCMNLSFFALTAVATSSVGGSSTNVRP